MNYKDIVKRLKDFNFSKKQKENLANIVSNAGGGGINTFEITINVTENSINVVLDGDTFGTVLESQTESLTTIKIDSRKLFAKLNDIIYDKKCFIIANVNFTVNNNTYSSPCFCNIIRSASDNLDIYITINPTLRINIRNTD